VENIKKIKTVSIWIFIVPFVSINLCLFISINHSLLESTIFSVDQIGRSRFTIPYIDGGVSISRTVRTYPTYLIFKPAMFITAILLIKYWIKNNALFKKIENKPEKNKKFLFFGISSAIFLVLHSIFLGIEYQNVFFGFLRRFVLLGFIIFEIIAQSLLVRTIIKVKPKIMNLINNKILILKIILVSTLIIVAVLSAPILNSSEFTHFKHGLEWNYFVGVISFYLFTFFFWKN
jgi:hypothetical protein